MTQTSAPPTTTEPAEPAKPRTKRIVLFTVGLGVIVLLAILGTMLPKADLDPAAQPTMTVPAAGYVSDAALAAWWTDSGSVPPSVLAVTKSVSWNGVALVAETKIVNDADAPDAAKRVCSALSAYGLTHGGFLPVQVLGSAGGVLVSRRSEVEACTWRG